MVGVTSAGVSYVPPREWYTLCVIDTAAYSGNLGKQGNAGGWISCDPSSCRRYDCLRFCCLYYSFFCRYMHPYCFVHRYFYYCLCSRASSAALHLTTEMYNHKLSISQALSFRSRFHPAYKKKLKENQSFNCTTHCRPPPPILVPTTVFISVLSMYVH